MHIAILYNRDHELLEDDPGREAREDVTRVAAALSEALSRGDVHAEPLAVEGSRLEFVDLLARMQPDLVINLCESMAADSRGEMIVPCLLDMLGLPFTGSPALSLGLALHKDKAKELLRARGVSTPGFARVERLEDVGTVDLPFPLIVKPSREDASVGISNDSVVHDRAALGRAVEAVLRTFHQPAIVEQFIAGREIYVPLLGNHPRRALPLTEIRFGKIFEDRPNIVTYAAKWETDLGRLPADPVGTVPARGPRAGGPHRPDGDGGLRRAGVPGLRARGPPGLAPGRAVRHRHQPQLRPPPRGGIRQGRARGRHRLPRPGHTTGGDRTRENPWTSDPSKERIGSHSLR